MARWIINRPEEHSNDGEIEVARQLRKLSDRWLIRWGFYYEDNNGQTREGDFLILGPHGGLLVLEVKGGRVRHFSSTGNWESDIAGQRDHPMAQLDAEWAAVIRAFAEAQPEGWTPTIKQALCVPNEIVKEGANSWMGIPRKHVVAGNDLNNFSSAWRRCFPEPDKAVHPRQREKFLSIYGGNSEPEKLREFLDHTEHQFRQQFTRSYTLLDTLADNRQLVIRGGPGTGKTWMAVEQASRLAENGTSDAAPGRGVLFLCYNLALADHLKNLFAHRKLARGSVTVFAWEALCEHVLSECGIDNAPPPEGSPSDVVSNYYENELPGILLECASDDELRSKLPQFDALVVDEAQDHDTNWWHFYFALIAGKTSTPMAIFYDAAQRPTFRSADGFDIGTIVAGLSQPAFASLPYPLRNGVENSGHHAA